MEEQKTKELYEKVLTACQSADNFTTYFIQKTFDLGYVQASEIKDMFYENGILQDEEIEYGKSDPLYSKAIKACKKANDFSALYIQSLFDISYRRAKAIKETYFNNK